MFDNDHVELSNLNRHVIRSAHGADVPKAENAVAAGARIASKVTVVGHQIRLTTANMMQNLTQIVSNTGLDIIVDGSGSFETKFTIHHGAVSVGMPVIFWCGHAIACNRLHRSLCSGRRRQRMPRWF